MLRRVALVRTDVSEEPSASLIRMTRISEPGTTLAAISNRRTLRRNTNHIAKLLRYLHLHIEYVFQDIFFQLLENKPIPAYTFALKFRPFYNIAMSSAVLCSKRYTSVSSFIRHIVVFVCLVFRSVCSRYLSNF
jgi:hypothetical protein